MGQQEMQSSTLQIQTGWRDLSSQLTFPQSMKSDKESMEQEPFVKLRDAEENLGPGTLTGKSVNNMGITFSGWINVKLQFESSGATSI